MMLFRCIGHAVKQSSRPSRKVAPKCTTTRKINQGMISCFFSSSQKIELGAVSATREIPDPTRLQLRAHYISNGLPFIGFGMMDQTGEMDKFFTILGSVVLANL